MGGDARVLANENRFVTVGYPGKFPGLQQDGIHRDAQAGGIERSGFVEINGTVATLDDVALVNGDVTLESDGLGFEIQVGAVRENLHAVVALDFHRAAEADAFLQVAFDLAALIVDLEVFRERGA